MSTHAHYLGGFYYSWGTFETLLEMLSRDELGIDNDRAHIVFCSLNASAKQEIAINLISLSDRANKDEVVTAIRRIPNIAKRNHITHSMLASNNNMTRFTFNKREISSGNLVVRPFTLSHEEMGEHFNALNDALAELQGLAGYDEAEMQSYFDALKAFIK